MPFASLSSETRIQDRMKLLGVSAAFLAALADVEVTKLSRAFRGISQLSNTDSERLLAVTSELLELAECVKPLALPLKSVPDMQQVLKILGGKSAQVQAVIATLFEDR